MRKCVYTLNFHAKNKLAGKFFIGLGFFNNHDQKTLLVHGVEFSQKSILSKIEEIPEIPKS